MLIDVGSSSQPKGRSHASNKLKAQGHTATTAEEIDDVYGAISDASLDVYPLPHSLNSMNAKLGRSRRGNRRASTSRLRLSGAGFSDSRHRRFKTLGLYSNHSVHPVEMVLTVANS